MDKRFKGPPRYRAAVLKAEQVLLDAWADKPACGRVDIYTWPHNRDGLRVSEVSFSSFNPSTGHGSGCSFMACDLEAANAILRTERAILALSHPSTEFPEDDAAAVAAMVRACGLSKEGDA